MKDQRINLTRKIYDLKSILKVHLSPIWNWSIYTGCQFLEYI